MVKKIVGYTLLTVVLLGGAVFAYLYFRSPESQPALNIKVAMTPERIERGRYMFMLADCDGCHSQHDETKLYLPVVEAGRGRGQEFKEEMPGRVTAPNITSDVETGIGAWSDGEKIRAIREGIGRDGRALFPMMPYEQFRYMSDEDVQALVAYLNSLPPVKHSLPGTQLDFPVSMLIKGAPQPVTKVVRGPDRNNRHQYGEYLVTIGLCEVCHTPFEQGSFDTSRRFAGGRRFNFNGQTVVTSNITPDRETGIGNWTIDYFLERFYRHQNYGPDGPPPASKELFTIMPWLNLSKLPREDLAAIYTYLKAQPPVVNKVDAHPVETAAAGRK